MRVEFKAVAIFSHLWLMSECISVFGFVVLHIQVNAATCWQCDYVYSGFFLAARISGEDLVIHSPPVFFNFF